MDRSKQVPTIDRLTTLVTNGEHDAAVECLGQFESAAIDRRKAAIRSLRSIAETDPTRIGGLVPALVPFLEDDQRSVRLTAGKLLVAVARVEPAAVRPAIDAVASRLADEEEC